LVNIESSVLDLLIPWNRGGGGARRVALVTSLCLLAIGTGAEAQPRPQVSASSASPAEVTGTVLALEEEGEELILDLGSAQGATEGTIVEIWRPLKLKHPVTGKVLTDRFRIGSLKLGQVRPTMSLAEAEGSLTRTPEKGDLVILRLAKPNPSAKPTGPEAPAERPEDAGGGAESKPEDPEAAAIAKMFDDLKGKDLVTRIRAYEDYVRAKPEGRFARVLYEEAASLRRLMESEGKPATKKPSGSPEPQPAIVKFGPPRVAVEGTPLAIAIELSDVTTGAILHVRAKGKQNYAHHVMASAGRNYWSATIPGNQVVLPGVEYFIEAGTEEGDSRSIVASPGNPEVVTILEAPKFAKPRKVLASAMLLTDYADYNSLKGNDRVWQTEGTFGLRYGDVGVRALRTGFGVYRGVGGSLDELDNLGLPGRPVGLTYGYLELEVAPHKFFSVIGRGAIGLLDDGLSGGGQILFRIGNDRDTNLILGGELLGGVGLRGFTQLELNTFKKVPILIRTEVTNQPAGTEGDFVSEPSESVRVGQVGVRAILQAGYRFTPHLVVSGRVSFQGRTINHAGPGFGGAVGYEW